MPFKKILLEGDAAGSTHTILDGSTHTDSVAQTISRGSLIYGNSTPKWDELVVGAANRVLWSDGTDISWSAAPRLADIADTGGTNRITTATTTPQVKLTGDVQVVSGDLGLRNAPVANVRLALNTGVGTTTTPYTGIQLKQTSGTNDVWFGIEISPTLIGQQDWRGIVINPNVTLEAGDGFSVTGVSGIATVKLPATTTGASIRGLNFQVTVNYATASGSGTAADVRIINGASNLLASAGGTLNITDMYGLYLDNPSITGAGTKAITNYYGIYIFGTASNTITNAIGLKIEDFTTATGNIYLAEIGPSTPYFRVKGNFTAAANVTPVYISEGATPTLRQLKTRVWDGTAGHGFTNGDLVCFLT